MRTDRQLIATGFVLLAADDLQRRDSLSGSQRLDDDFVGVTGELVDLLADVLAFDEVVEDDLSLDGGENRRGEGIPIDQRRTRLDIRSIRDQQVRPVGDRVTLFFALPLVVDHEFSGP